MRKVIKNILSFISILILFWIIVPLMLIVALSNNTVQNIIVNKATKIISKKLETKVSIDRIGINFFNKISLKGFYVEDLNKDTLLYVSKLQVGFRGYNLMNGAISLGSVSIDGGAFYINQDSTGVSNLKRITDKLKSDKPKDSTAVFLLKASSLEISSFHFKMKKYTPTEKDGVNFSDLDVKNINLRFRKIKVRDDNINVSIDRLALEEKSGFKLDKLASRSVSVSPKGLKLRRLTIQNPTTNLRMPYLYFIYKDWNAYNDFVNDVTIYSEINRSSVDFSTIGYFAPSLKAWQNKIKDFSGVVKGPVSNLSGELNKVDISGVKLSTEFEIVGLPDINKTALDVKINSLSGNATNIGEVFGDFAKNRSMLTSVKPLMQMGDITMDGYFKGYVYDFESECHIKSTIGNINVKGHMDQKNDLMNFYAEVNTQMLNAGKALSINSLGIVNSDLKAEGSLLKNKPDIKINGTLHNVAFNNYNYSDINIIDGKITDTISQGQIKCNDVNLKFDLTGELSSESDIPVYKFDMNLGYAELSKLGINKRDSVSMLRGRFKANASGNSLDNINSNIIIDNLTYIGPIDTVSTPRITLTAMNSERGKYMTMDSEFAEVSFRGRHSYQRMFSYLENTLLKYVNIGIEDAGLSKNKVAIDSIGNFDLYAVRLIIKKANNLAAIFYPGVSLAEGTKALFVFNPQADTMSFSLDSKYIKTPTLFASDIKVDVKAKNDKADSISIFANASELIIPGVLMPDFDLKGSVKDNKITLSTKFNNEINKTACDLNTRARILQSSNNKNLKVEIVIVPSSLNVADMKWDINSDTITIDSTGVKINRFRVSHNDQLLSVNGKASDRMEDTLKINFRRFDLTPITRLISRYGYNVSGLMNGYANIASTSDDRLMDAKINFDSIKINDKPVPSSVFTSEWMNDAKRIRLGLVSSKDTIFSGSYMPETKRYYIRSNIPSLDLSYLDPILKDVLRETEGRASVNLVASGGVNRLSLNGSILIKDFASTIDYTNVRYTLTGNKNILVKGGSLSLDTEIQDAEGGKAKLNLSLKDILSDLKFEVNVKPDKLLSLKTSPANNDQFYGTAYSSGDVTIKGEKNKVNMDINVSTQKTSNFSMQISDKSSIGEADFITFRSVNPTVVSDLDEIKSSARKEFLSGGELDGEAKSNMSIDMRLNVQPNTNVMLMIDPQNGGRIEGKGTGVLTMKINPTRDIFTLNGDYEIQQGKYSMVLLGIITRDFSVKEGYLSWTGNPTNPTLNITGQYITKASIAPLIETTDPRYKNNVQVDCNIELTGPLMRPQIGLNIEVPYADTETQSLVKNALNTTDVMYNQFFSLLLNNNFTNVASNPSLNIGMSSGTTSGFEFLSAQVSKLLSNDKYHLGVRFRPKSEMTSDEIEIGFSTDIVKNRLLVEAEGNYDFGNNQTMTTRKANSLTGDFAITWLIDPSGKLRAKGFTRTIDRFDENQGLQENGIGVYYREDFNTFNELFRKYFKRNKDKKIEDKE